jgi:hypothetical protein
MKIPLFETAMKIVSDIFHNKFVYALLLNIFLIISLFSGNTFSQEKDYVAKIEYESNLGESQIRIRGYFINQTADTIEVDYILQVQKISSSGNAVSDQKGTVKGFPGEKIFLSESGMNIDKNAIYIITLQIKNEEHILADASLSLTGNEF